MSRFIRMGTLSFFSFSLIHCEVTEMIGACFQPSSIEVIDTYDDRVVYEIHDESYGFDRHEPLILEEHLGSLYLEGDIIFGDLDELFIVEQRGNIRQYPTCGSTSLSPRVWDNGEIPYVLPDDLSSKDRDDILEALAAWNESTLINFRPREPNDRDYITFVYHYKDSSRCSSFLGRKGGRQEIRMAYSGCGLGTMIHELGHAIGLAHEHTRCDRDEHIEIYWDNIRSDLRHNFNKSCQIDRPFGSYDYESVMHYSSRAFSIDGRITIGPLNPEVSFIRGGFPSEGDISAVNHLVNLSDSN